MGTRKSTTEPHNIFLRLHPLQRILVSCIAAAGAALYFIKDGSFSFLLSATAVWDVFALSFIIMCWIVFFKRTHHEINRLANLDDGSRVFVLVSILIATFASMFAVILLMTSKSGSNASHIMSMPIAIAGMTLSWIMVHTIFTFHYAHLYYGGYEEVKTSGLDFPNEKKPDYLDFAYFSFVIGMTFQVSDVTINTSTIRRTALAHGLLAFVLNTFVVALTINLIAGLKG
ncbi:MAG: DUF1345 domain-containing protein [Bacteroidetes bacterium]|nr:DUF1345 domain-containing protein [Bacteroidota bacterium]